MKASNGNGLQLSIDRTFQFRWYSLKFMQYLVVARVSLTNILSFLFEGTCFKIFGPI